MPTETDLEPFASLSGDDDEPDRPVRRNPVQTQASILGAATREFAAHGLQGGRTDRIADDANVNKRMIFHYFGSKEGLFQAVLEANYAKIRSAEAKLELTSRVPVEAMAELVQFSFDWFVMHPEFVPLLNEANLHQGRHVQSSKQVRNLNMPLVELIENVLDRGVAAGQMRAGVDPIELYISIAGISYFYFSNRHTLSGIFGRDLMAKESLARRRAHVVSVVLGYLRPENGLETFGAGHED